MILHAILTSPDRRPLRWALARVGISVLIAISLFGIGGQLGFIIALALFVIGVAVSFRIRRF